MNKYALKKYTIITINIIYIYQLYDEGDGLHSGDGS